MIKLDGVFFSTVNKLYDEFNASKTREQIFNDCVEERLSSVLTIQGEYFDKELNKLEESLDWDFYNTSNIKRVAKILGSLYKIIARDRISIIDSLISICEVQ